MNQSIGRMDEVSTERCETEPQKGVTGIKAPFGALCDKFRGRVREMWLRIKKGIARSKKCYLNWRFEYPRLTLALVRGVLILIFILIFSAILSFCCTRVLDEEVLNIPFGDIKLGTKGFFGTCTLGMILSALFVGVICKNWELIIHYLYLPFLFLAIILIIAAGVGCGMFLPEWQWLNVQILKVIETPLLLALAVGTSIFVIFALWIMRNKASMTILWPSLMTPVLGFWILATVNGFQWESLLGIAWSLGVIILLVFPLLRWNVNPRSSGKTDALGRRMLYRRIGSRLRLLVKVHDSQGVGVAVAVCGPWGSGKSHFIDYLAYTLWDRCKDPDMKSSNCYMGRFTVCSVDLWRCQDKESMWQDIASTLASAISGFPVRDNSQWLIRIFNALQLSPFRSESLVQSILQLVATGADAAGLNERALNQRIAFPRRAYILVLDNLDRCNEDVIRSIFPVIERLRRIRGLITICALAREEIERQDINGTASLRGAGETLIKVFDLMVNLPTIPVMHARAFMLHKIDEQVMECPNFKEWIMHQNLEFDTPRQMENVVNQLSVLDNCYLMRLRSEIERKGNHSVYQQRFDAIFYMAALRGIFPGVSSVLEKSENPMVLIQTARDAFASVVGNEYHLKNGAFPPVWGIGNGENVESRLLRALLVALSECSVNDLKEALSQSYLRLTALSGDECRSVIDFALNSYQKPKIALAKLFSKEYTDAEEPALYRSVLEFAINVPTIIAAVREQEYVSLCLKYDISHPEGMYREYLTSPELAWRLAEAGTKEIDNQAWFEGTGASGWEKILCRLLNNMPTLVIGEALQSFEIHDSQGGTYPAYHEYAPTFYEVMESVQKKKADVYHAIWKEEHFLKFNSIKWSFIYMFSKKYFGDIIHGERSSKSRKILARMKLMTYRDPLKAGLHVAVKQFFRLKEMPNMGVVEENLLREIGGRRAVRKIMMSDLMDYLTPTYVELWIELRRSIIKEPSVDIDLRMKKEFLVSSLGECKGQVDVEIRSMRSQGCIPDSVRELRLFRLQIWRVMREIKFSMRA